MGRLGSSQVDVSVEMLLESLSVLYDSGSIS